jgi:nitrate reductase gamma subunit
MNKTDIEEAAGHVQAIVAGATTAALALIALLGLLRRLNAKPAGLSAPTTATPTIHQ